MIGQFHPINSRPALHTVMDDDDKKSTSVPGFLTKTFDIFSNPAYQDLCGWNESGDMITIKRVFAVFMSIVVGAQSLALRLLIFRNASFPSISNIKTSNLL